MNSVCEALYICCTECGKCVLVMSITTTDLIHRIWGISILYLQISCTTSHHSSLFKSLTLTHNCNCNPHTTLFSDPIRAPPFPEPSLRAESPPSLLLRADPLPPNSLISPMKNNGIIALNPRAESPSRVSPPSPPLTHKHHE